MKRQPAENRIDTIVVHAKNGEPEAREAVFGDLRRELRKRASKEQGRLPAAVDVSDLAQGAVLRVLQRFSALNATTGADLQKYAQKALKSCLLDLYRRQGRKKRRAGQTVSLEELPYEPVGKTGSYSGGPLGGSEKDLQRRQEERRLWGRILLYPPEHRQILWHRREGKTVSEIAALLGCRDKQVAGKLERMISTLRKESLAERDIQEELPEEAPVLAAFLAYLQKVERGEQVDRELFLREHAGQAPLLEALLSGLSWLDGLD